RAPIRLYLHAFPTRRSSDLRTPGVPITTNLMTTGDFAVLDYWRWAPELTGRDRLVSMDHYIVPSDPVEPPAQVAYGADRTRSLADRKSTRLNSSHVKISYAV